ncbi:MAG TPA: AI-2E family transporter [Planctomycetaceae bacterium]|nr:AI-2E family transporter [Planctomycetaceae bacterium]
MSTDIIAAPEPWKPRRVLLATLTVAAVVAAFAAVYVFGNVLFLLFVGIVLATAFEPLIQFLQRHGTTRNGAVSLVYLGIGLGLTAGAVFGLPLLVDQIGHFAQALPSAYDGFRHKLTENSSSFVRRMAVALPTAIDLEDVPAETEGMPLEQVAQAISYSSIVLWSAFSIGAAVVLAFYWSLYEQRTVQSVLLLVPERKRKDARELFAAMQEKVGAYLRGQAILCLTVAIMSLVCYWLIGLPYVLPLSLVAGVLEAVPMFGPILGALPAVLVGLSVSTSHGMWAIGVAFLIQQIENYFLVPRVMDRSVGVKPVITLLAIAGFGSLFGVAGAILAIPMAAILQLLVDRFVIQAESPESQPAGRDLTNVLRYQARELIRDVQSQFRKKENETNPGNDELEDAVELLARDLDRLLAAETTHAAEVTS